MKFWALSYSIPANPSRYRVAVWKALKELGAVYLQPAVAVVPQREGLREALPRAIAAVEQDIDRVTAAKAADELLTLRGVRASFVLFKHDTGVNLSARSLGEINVQLIMEKLGGGGNSTTAGGQIPDGTVDAVREQLIAAIDQYLEG